MSPIIDDLRIDAEIPPRSARPGSSVQVTLRFINVGSQPRTIFLIRSEEFRANQSTFVLERGAGVPPLVQPPPRPHGYVVTQADFHVVKPRAQLAFTQTLRLPPDLKIGQYDVRWIYENTVDHWEGGTVTLDGPTQPVNDGKPIPGIWLGTIEDRFTVSVAGRRLGAGDRD